MKTIDFRFFEERDIDFIYKCKNDEKLNHMIVGQYHPFTYEEASLWVRNCMKGDRDDLQFWAICTNDDEKKIIGWASISKIDKINRSAFGNGTVIADKDYKDGMAFIETQLYLFKYVFEILKLNRFYGCSLIGNKSSNLVSKLLLMKTEGILRQAVFKNDQFYDLQYDGILRDEYYAYKDAGEYEMKAILKRLKVMRMNGMV